ncbi:MAG: hypothetical protein SPG61_03465 [Arcanobacterium sp.]|nr:hypothetical protein [Arcanobacterium sp.]
MQMKESRTAVVLGLLEQGLTIIEVARKAQVSEIFVQVMLEHLERIGKTDSANSLCAGGTGACGPNGAQTVEAKISCAGCFFAKK